MSWGSYAYGAAAFGGAAAVASVTTPVVHGLNVRLYVGGYERTGQLLNDKLRITDELGSRNTCTFTLKDDTKSLRIEVGAVVRVTLDEWPIFAGTLDEVSEETAGDFSDVNLIDCSAVDWAQLCDRHIVAARFDTPGQTLKQVVESIVNMQSGDAGERLSDEGMTTAGVQEGPVLSTVSFGYDTVAKCFDELAELTGYTWYVDARKDLKFYERKTYYAPFELDDAKWQSYRGLKFRRSREKYRNMQYLLAGTARTNPRTESFVGDGEVRTYTLSMPCAEKPVLEKNDVAIDPASIAVRVNDEDQKDIEWFYKVGDKQISQNADTTLYTALGASDTLDVTYRGQYPIAEVVRDDTEIAARKAAESDFGVSTGVYCDVEDDDSIDDLEMAIERAVGMLRRYARVEDTLEFETDVPGFRRGQILRVVQPDFGANGDYLITRCEFEYVADTLFRYSISAINGEDMGGWADYFKRLADKGRPFVIGENDAINIVRSRTDGIIVGDRVSQTDPLRDWNVDPASYWVFGLSKIGGRRRLTAEGDEDTGVVYGPMIGHPLHGPQTAYARIAEVTVMAYDSYPPAFPIIAQVTTAGLNASAANIAVPVPLTFAGFEQGQNWELQNEHLMDNAEMSTTYRRTGDYALYCYPAGTTDGSAEFSAWGDDGASTYWDKATVFTKFHLRIESVPAVGKTEQVCGWWDQSGYIKARVHVNHDGNLLLYNKQGTDALVATGTTDLNMSQWYRIEVKIGTGVTGAYELKIDGVSEYSGTSDFSTSNHSSAWLGRTGSGFTSDDASAEFYFDDVSYDAGDWIGDSKVLPLHVSGDSAVHTGWTASSGNKWECVNEDEPNGDTTYITSSTANAVYTGTCESCATAGISGTIRAAMGVTWAKKTSGSTTKIKTRVRSGSTDSDMATFSTLSSTEYWAFVHFLAKDPATAADWTTSGLDGAEVGPLKENNTLGVRCTAAMISVEFKP